MGKLTMTTFVSLDGVMQAPGGPGEDPSGGFRLGGWMVPYVDEVFGKFIDGVFRRADAFLLGRTTYQIFAGHWPRVTDPDDLIAAKLNALPKHVASRTLKKLDWKGSSLIEGGLPEAVSALKSRYPGELQVHGSCGLIQSLLQADLVDELNVLTFPVVLGGGRRLFGPGAVAARHKLVSTQSTPGGAIIATYRRDGLPEQGNFQLPPE